jgi:hypothetical protein
MQNAFYFKKAATQKKSARSGCDFFHSTLHQHTLDLNHLLRE